MCSVFLLCFFCLFPAFVQAQRWVPVDVAVETKDFFWTLDSVGCSDGSVSIKWTVESKRSDRLLIDKRSVWIEKEGARYHLKEVVGRDSVSEIAIGRDRTMALCFVYDRLPVSAKTIDVHLGERDCIWGLDVENGSFARKSNYRIPTQSVRDSMERSDACFERGMELFKEKRYEEAIRCFTEVEKIDSALYSLPILGMYFKGLNHDRPYVHDYESHWKNACLHELGLDSLISSYAKSNPIEPYDRKKVKVSDSLKLRYPEFSLCLDNRHLTFAAYKRACELDSLQFGMNSSRYVSSLLDLAGMYVVGKKYEDAIAVCLDALKIAEERRFNQYFQYKKILLELGRTYNFAGNYVQSIAYFNAYYEWAGADKKYAETENSDILVDSYVQTGQFGKASMLLQEYIRRNEAVKYSTNPYGYVAAVIRYADYLGEIADYKESVRQYKKVIDLGVNLSAEQCLKVGQGYLNLYDYDKAEFYFKKANEAYDDFWFKYYEELRTIKVNLAVVAGKKKNFKQAIAYSKEALDLCHVRFDSKTQSLLLAQYHQYQKIISHLAGYYIQNGQCDSAIVCERNNLLLKDNYYVPDSPVRIYSYINLGEAYLCKGDLQQALEYMNRAYEASDKNYLQYQRIISNLVVLNYRLGHREDACRYLAELYAVNHKKMANLFTDLTLNEKIGYWNQHAEFYVEFLPKYVCLLKSDSLNAILYDSFLESKGILLNSEKDLKHRILSSKNRSVMDKYELMKIRKYQLVKQLELPEEERRMDVDSLSEGIERLEDELIVESESFADFSKRMRADWKEVQACLDEDGVAIEFFNYPVAKDTVAYAALCLTREGESPQLVPLFERPAADLAVAGILHNPERIYKLFWKPLKKVLRGKNRVYFSPSGIIHVVGLEFVRELKGKKVFRLSSTKELLKRHEEKVTEAEELERLAVLYGGLEYDGDAVAEEETADSLPEEYGFNSRGIYSRDFRSYLFADLEHTKFEIQEVDSALGKLQFKNRVYMGNRGTEESFKALSGAHCNLIHLATHGGYVPATRVRNVRNVNKMDFLIPGSADKRYEEEIAMTHSFLLMSGANNTIRQQGNEDGDDGFLTAQEISQLYFPKLELVVLSACQTGLGDITEEGVWGLQRGFKKAGAQSILMSLTSVEDAVAKEFMSLFYRNLSLVRDVNEAFEEAQLAMRKRYADQPENWMSFILLDALP